MKTALCIMLDDNFMKLFRVFAKSFLQHNRWFDNDLVVIDVGLSDKSKAEIKTYFYRADFRKPKKNNYGQVNMNRTADRLKNTYYTIDLFLYDDYDRIVFLDVDIVVQGDIKELFNFEGSIGAVKCYALKQDKLVDSMNAGVFVIGKKLLNTQIYRKLMRIIARGHSMPEQRAMNILFRDQIEWFPKKYNVEKRMLHSKAFPDQWEKAVIIHYVAQKPYEESDNHLECTYGEIEKIWWDYHNKLGG
jgi:lipopolysaccharide biosynthesis glycosyltransferase